MGFNKRKMEDARRQEAEKEAAVRRATEKHIRRRRAGFDLASQSHRSRSGEDFRGIRHRQRDGSYCGAAVPVKPVPPEPIMRLFW